MGQRHKDTFQHFLNFATPTYVECPKCTGCAVIIKEDKDKSIVFTANLITCLQCGFNSDTKRSGSFGGGDSIYTIFKWHEDNLPLWLQIPCAENTLYAFNPNHLAFLEAYVSAKLRERKPDEKYGWSNRSMASRLPAWIKSKKNREDILKAINKLWLKVEKEGLSRPVIEG